MRPEPRFEKKKSIQVKTGAQNNKMVGKVQELKWPMNWVGHTVIPVLYIGQACLDLRANETLLLYSVTFASDRVPPDLHGAHTGESDGVEPAVDQHSGRGRGRGGDRRRGHRADCVTDRRHVSITTLTHTAVLLNTTALVPWMVLRRGCTWVRDGNSTHGNIGRNS